MLTLDPDKLAAAVIPVATGWFLGSCMEARGKQDLWIRQKPEALAVLREQAMVQSVESSNRIEGVTVAPDRLRPVILGKARPKDRSEAELAGYRRALEWVFSRRGDLAVTPDVIKRLHALAQGGVGDAGQWKGRDNEIVEILPTGERLIRFIPTSAKDTPGAMEALCRNYRIAEDEAKVPPLLLIASFIFDLLCIHPFRDGNGRVSRLTTTLLLQSQGFEVARFVSLERLIEESKDEYYRVLGTCSEGWAQGTCEIIPWWNYFLGVLRRAYQEFERQVESVEARPAKSDLIRRTVLDQLESFTLGDLAAQLPAVSTHLIKKVLAQMKAERQIRLSGRGRGARWEIIR